MLGKMNLKPEQITLKYLVTCFLVIDLEFSLKKFNLYISIIKTH